MTNFFSRVAGAATLDSRTYEDVEADKTATPQALAVIVLAAFAAGIGASGWRSELTSVLTVSASAATLALLGWMCWALITFEIGSRLLAEPGTRTDVGELLRTLGFSAAPGLFLVFGMFPGLTTPVFALTAVWLLAAMVMALRQALDYSSLLRALAVCSIGWLLALAFVMFFSLLSQPVLSAQTAPAAPSRRGALYEGGQLYKMHCATCHGTTGHGDGPTAAAMREPPPDLTRFAMRNGGEFPVERLKRIIDGRDVPSHGDRNMPVWGVTLRSSRDTTGYDSAEERIDALVRYLQSIQERAAQ